MIRGDVHLRLLPDHRPAAGGVAPIVRDHLGYNSVLAGLIITRNTRRCSAALTPGVTPTAGAEEGGAVRPGLLVLAALFSRLAFGVDGYPWLSLLLLCVGRVFLGVGESFISTGSTLWGIGRVRVVHPPGDFLERRCHLRGDGGRGAAWRDLNQQ